MRKKVTLLVLVLFVSSLTSAHAASPKPGSSCAKLGQTVKSSGTALSCTRVGKKLIWSVRKVSSVIPVPLPTPKAQVGDYCYSEGAFATENLQCRISAGNQLRLFDYASTFTALKSASSPLSFDQCQIPDRRAKIIQQQGIAFPTKPWNADFTSHSKLRIAIFPVDFPDSPGVEDPQLDIKQIQQETDRWAQWYSRGKLTFEWIPTPNSWVRANGNSSEYDWIHPESSVNDPDPQAYLKIGERLVALADEHMDVTRVQTFLFVYPKGTKIKDGIGFSRTTVTSKGNIWLGIFADSADIRNSGSSMSQWFIHEIIHRFGWVEHSPSYPQVFSVSHSGFARPLDSWGRLVLDWVNPGDLYCTSSASLKGEEITLVPLEREQLGVQGVGIKLSETKMLLIESHRSEGWNTTLKTGFGGITAMVVDTTIDTDRSCEWGKDPKHAPCSHTANYLNFNLNHWIHPQNRPYHWEWELNYVLYPGESFDYEGVHVEFTNSGINDTVKLTYNK